MEVFIYSVDSKTKDRDFQKRGFGHRHSGVAVIGPDVEFDLVHSSFYANTLGDRMLKQPSVSTVSRGHLKSRAVYPPQAHIQATCGNASGDVDGVN